MFLKNASAFVRNLAIPLCISIGLILVAELFAWIFNPERYEDPPPVTVDAWIRSDALDGSDTTWMKEFVDEFCRSYHARWTSYVYFKRQPFSGKLINVDTNGIRYTPQFALKEKGTLPPLKVYLLGGSTMWGTCARDSGTIPSALARIIATEPTSRPVQVINMGESGYVSTQGLIRLELELRRGNIPDVVLLYDGVNEVFSAFQNGEAGLPQNEMHRQTEFNLLKEPGRMRSLGLGDLLNRTLTAEVVTRIQSTIAAAPPTPKASQAIAGEVIRVYRENLRLVDALSKQYGFHYEAYWQPVAFVRSNPSAYERGESERMKDVRPLFLEAYKNIQQDESLQRNPRFHDISGVFDTVSSPIYLDFCHISEKGNAIVAKTIYADIRARLQSEPVQ